MTFLEINAALLPPPPTPQVVIIAAPANAHPDLLTSVAPFIDDGAAVGALFAQVGL